MLYILYGPDDYSIEKALEEIKLSLGDAEALATNSSRFPGKDLNPAQLHQAVETMPFLAEKRLVVIDGLLERFEGSAGGRRRKKNSNVSEFIGPLTRVPETTVVVLVEPAIKGNSEILATLMPSAKIRQFPLLKDPQLKKWILDRVAVGGGSINLPAATQLLKLVGGNLWSLNGEINKLVLYKDGEAIEAADVERVVGFQRQDKIFVLMDAVIAGDAAQTQRHLRRFLEDGLEPAIIMRMLARQLRLMVQANEMKGRREGLPEMQRKMGLFSEYALRHVIQQAAAFTLPRLNRMYHYLVEADLGIKQGRYSAELSLEMLLAQLCQLSGSGGQNN